MGIMKAPTGWGVSVFPASVTYGRYIVAIRILLFECMYVKREMML